MEDEMKDGGAADRASQMELALLRITARHAIEKCTSAQQLRAAIDALLSARQDHGHE